jgi:hypothetical protein
VRGRGEGSICMRVGRSLAVLVAVLALGACGADDDGGQTQGAEDLSDAWDDQLTSQQQQYACDAFRTVGAQAAGNQIATITDGRVDADDAAAVLEEKC